MYIFLLFSLEFYICLPMRIDFLQKNNFLTVLQFEVEPWFYRNVISIKSITLTNFTYKKRPNGKKILFPISVLLYNTWRFIWDDRFF